MLLRMMNTIEEIEEVIGGLPREAAWDAQMEADAASGRLDALWGQADKEIEAGESQSLDAFLGHQKL